MVVISKATVNPRLSASPETPFMPICFFTTNFNRVSQLVQIRMSGDKVLWENFMQQKNEVKEKIQMILPPLEEKRLDTVAGSTVII